MFLALKFVLIILIELPIISLFFKRKKRQEALLMSLLINVITWAVSSLIFITTDINMYYVAIVLAIGEAIAFYKVLKCNWTKAIIMSLIVNSLSFFATQLVPVDLFQVKPEIKNTTSEYYHGR